MSVYVEVVHVLFVLSTALLYPVILALLLIFGWSLALVGSLISEYTSRHRDLHELERVCAEASKMARSGHEDIACNAVEGYRAHPQVSKALSEAARSFRSDASAARIEKTLQDAELGMGKALEPIKIGVRVGPMLGLMGTLIPMGPALISLSQGDIQQMADSLVIAFSTTVIGLAVGGICYGVFVVRNRWYRQDLSDLEYAAELLSSGRSQRTSLGGGSEASG
ncbi:MotA/TolQ/ExbB proton channel family protein [Candidatus Methanocrinis natronophilus]|uniref:MotA/TolQ/ExbB proton channel family protein n=1 Tax=Candidatus Methanocrinis natronophilus TaxID=3033396 RepID=A0ABT5X5B3_9EURY|nr:MotA/TolQ/ExbB proton channel family protein [Candidatus Methanocrinis natronophilus]MDF0589884.1 MotA/TolQ/ExbB proton channel family protein [Candidatus Methanocrinis natronophilus]